MPLGWRQRIGPIVGSVDSAAGMVQSHAHNLLLPMGATLVNWRMSSTYRSSVLKGSLKAGPAESAQT